MLIDYIEGSQSDSGQESFVIAMLEGKRDGYYVEIGAADAVRHSNTLILETKYNWTGVGFDNVESCVEDHKANRRNPCLLADAMTFDYRTYFEENNFPHQIDYLQLDIEPPEHTLAALKQLPLDSYRFSTITYEHDYYNDPAKLDIKLEAEAILKRWGYSKVADNVIAPNGNPFEDWWIDPQAVSVTIKR